ncbi:hypothetical protein HDV06_003723 [Boothiomyces sp. JEL0866]|nr:hypothetical protein HDV06_003707 [Boothiomyces sp. JEL0866]KAJ3321986.1 hypothetical protein HDV06_003723 [Boothiomyces sp. JEL0866]
MTTKDVLVLLNNHIEEQRQERLEQKQRDMEILAKLGKIEDKLNSIQRAIGAPPDQYLLTEDILQEDDTLSSIQTLTSTKRTRKSTNRASSYEATQDEEELLKDMKSSIVITKNCMPSQVAKASVDGYQYQKKFKGKDGNISQDLRDWLILRLREFINNRKKYMKSSDKSTRSESTI